MRSLVKGLPIPESFNPSRAPHYPFEVQRPVEAFDVNEYFTILEHLSRQDGYTLDYLYSIDSLGAQPYIYARNLNEPPFKTQSEMIASLFDTQVNLTSEQWDKVIYSYLEHIQVDDTPEGFFQLIALRIMGSQFYLWWHAVYNDHAIVCHKEAAIKILSSFQPLEDEQKLNLLKQLPQFDLEPEIEIRENTVFVRVVTFTKKGGLIQREYTVARQFPHVVLDSNMKTLISYYGGVVP